MRKTFFSFAFAIFTLSVSAQNSSKALEAASSDKSYALLDLGFSAKILHLSTGKALSEKKETVKKSPRSLDEIFAKTKKESVVERYYLIAGCFSSNANAKSFEESLAEQGYKSNITRKDGEGLYMVSYQSFEREEEAINFLEELKNKGVSSWIRKQ